MGDSAPESPPELSDLTLIHRLRSGRDDAANELYIRYAKRLHGLARRQTSAAVRRQTPPEDIVQSVFRTFFRRVKRGDYDVPEGDELWRLLLVITLNKIRRAAVYHTAQRRDIRRTVNQENSAFEKYLALETGRAHEALLVLQLVIDDLIGGLPEVKAKMVRLRIDGCEIDEISQRTQRSKRTVERTLQEFRENLHSSLGENLET